MGGMVGYTGTVVASTPVEVFSRCQGQLYDILMIVTFQMFRLSDAFQITGKIVSLIHSSNTRTHACYPRPDTSFIPYNIHRTKIMNFIL